MLAVLLLLGCGRKGGLVPAWIAKAASPPKPISDLAAELRAGRIWLTWTEPLENLDRSRPARLERYMVYYDALALEAKFCLDCPLDLSQKMEVDPSQRGEAVFEGRRVAVPVADFKPERKYVFIVLALDPDDVSGGDSNVATFNWPAE